MKKLIKSLLISTAAIASIAGTVTTVVSCGNAITNDPVVTETQKALDNLADLIKTTPDSKVTLDKFVNDDKSLLTAVISKWSKEATDALDVLKSYGDGVLTFTNAPTNFYESSFAFDSSLTWEANNKQMEFQSQSSISWDIGNPLYIQGRVDILAEAITNPASNFNNTGSASNYLNITTRWFDSEQLINDLAVLWQQDSLVTSALADLILTGNGQLTFSAAPAYDSNMTKVDFETNLVWTNDKTTVAYTSSDLFKMHFFVNNPAPQNVAQGLIDDLTSSLITNPETTIGTVEKPLAIHKVVNSSSELLDSLTAIWNTNQIINWKLELLKLVPGTLSIKTIPAAFGNTLVFSSQLVWTPTDTKQSPVTSSNSLDFVISNVE